MVSVYREFLSQWHAHTIHTPRWKRVSVCHSATTSECLSFNERYLSSSVTPQLLLPQEWNFHCCPGTHSTLPPLCCFGCRLSLVQASSDAWHALCHDKKDYERAYTYSYKRDELRLIVSSINPLWFWNSTSCILLWLRFAAVGLHTITSKLNWLLFL